MPTEVKRNTELLAPKLFDTIISRLYRLTNEGKLEWTNESTQETQTWGVYLKNFGGFQITFEDFKKGDLDGVSQIFLPQSASIKMSIVEEAGNGKMVLAGQTSRGLDVTGKQLYLWLSTCEAKALRLLYLFSIANEVEILPDTEQEGC